MSETRHILAIVGVVLAIGVVAMLDDAAIACDRDGGDCSTPPSAGQSDDPVDQDPVDQDSIPEEPIDQDPDPAYCNGRDSCGGGG